jgi:hypothetical protein
VRRAEMIFLDSHDDVPGLDERGGS